ncbi:hypothetical protein HYT33_00330 [Candidatus Roizmanbacteria bacterium]|nr:hypothetical protein [Candidatus Roizmanbacteria bacterium]
MDQEGESYNFTPLTHKSSKKTWFLVALAIVLLVGIGVGVYLIRQQQILQERAAIFAPRERDSCNLVGIKVEEIPACPRLSKQQNGVLVPPQTPDQTNNVATYKTTYRITNITSQPHVVSYKKFGFFCTKPYGTCNENGQIVEDTVTIEAEQSFDVVVDLTNPTGSACGTFQTDFLIFAIDGNNSCVFQGKKPGSIGAAGLCETGIPCPEIPPTATPSATPTETVTPTSTPSATVTLTTTPTNTPTPTGTRTPTPTEIILAQSTPTPTGTITPTSTSAPTQAPTVPAAGSPAGVFFMTASALLLLVLLFL